ncbi:MAG: hypothetical protein K8R37_15400, partial [Bacteroidales bacterium]|nr:hypothetical protein [Bacteroidales bacterium]
TMKTKILLVSIAIIFSGMVYGQKIKLVSGNLDFLKGQKVLKVDYNYENMSVGKFDNEEDYIAKKVKDYNEDEPGKGDEWREAWFNDRASRYQPFFEELINKYLEDKKVVVSPVSKDAKYTMILKTTFTEPGFNVGVARKPAMINADVIFIETGNPDNELAKIVITKSPGSGAWGADFDTGYRIQEAYAKCGKELGKYLSKKAF